MLKKIIVLLLCLIALPLSAQAVDTEILNGLQWRNIGPAIMGGRVTDIEGVIGKPNHIYVATASGGLWKTENRGTTWRCIFEKENTISIGDIAIDPKNPDVIWVGSGESNVRNSGSIGDGVYKSTDGGKTWQHMGLKETEHISRIVIHPHNTDIIYVGALGHAYGSNDERGVFRSKDAGKTWQKVLYIDKKHGVADLDIDPENPNILYAAMWHFERKPWTHTSGSTEGGIFRTIDGGDNWNKLTSGLPKLMGRAGVKIAPSDPKRVYVIAETQKGVLFRSDNKGDSFQTVCKDDKIVARGFYYADLRIDPKNSDRVYALASNLYYSIDGGKNFAVMSPRTHVDYHALWIDPQDPSTLWQGQDGGVAVSYDRGKNWTYINNMPLCQVYQLGVDNTAPFYNIHFGLQDNGCWTGPSRTYRPYGILNADWKMVSFGDGFFIFNHPKNPNLFVSESQGGYAVINDIDSKEEALITPYPKIIWGGPVSEGKYRFHWNSPLIPSHHNDDTIYFAGNVVFRSQDFGQNWQVISPDLTTNDLRKQQTAGGPVWQENTAAEYHCAIISLSESPLDANVLWAGTDDGNLHVSWNQGKTWSNVIENIPKLPNNSPVSHIELSRVDKNVVYAAFDRHMLDDFHAYIYQSSDGGKTWQNISGNIPSKSYVWVVREDPKNPNVLYAGTEMGLYVTYNNGKHWSKLHLQNLPTVAIHDIIIHQRDNDMILGTHGRGVWIYDDITAFQNLPKLENEDIELFDIRTAYSHSKKMMRYGIGDGIYVAPNPPYGALIDYYVSKDMSKTKLKLEIYDDKGKLVRSLDKLNNQHGIHRVVWNLQGKKYKGRFKPQSLSMEVLPGNYRVHLLYGDKHIEKTVSIKIDPNIPYNAKQHKENYNHAKSILEMRDTLHQDLQKLDIIDMQLKQLKTRITQLSSDKQSSKTLDSYMSKVKEIKGTIERHTKDISPYRLFFCKAPKLADELSFFSSASKQFAMTAAQVAYLADLKKQHTKASKDIQALVEQALSEWNAKLLQEYNVSNWIFLKIDKKDHKAKKPE